MIEHVTSLRVEIQTLKTGLPPPSLPRVCLPIGAPPLTTFVPPVNSSPASITAGHVLPSEVWATNTGSQMPLGSTTIAQASSARGSHSLPLLRPAPFSTNFCSAMRRARFGNNTCNQRYNCLEIPSFPTGMNAAQASAPHTAKPNPFVKIWRSQEITSVALTTFCAVVPATGSPTQPTSKRTIQVFHPSPLVQTPPPSLFATGRRPQSSETHPELWESVLQTALDRRVQLAPVVLSASHAAISAAALLTIKSAMNRDGQTPSSPTPAHILRHSTPIHRRPADIPADCAPSYYVYSLYLLLNNPALKPATRPIVNAVSFHPSNSTAMGIKDLWSLVDDAAFTCKLRDFVLEHGFIKDHYGSRTVVIGVDISSFLDGYHASSRAKGQLHTLNSTLTQFYKMLCSLSKSGAHCIFVYDGDERPSVKRGKQVV
ncbi:MAG: hypothetical protein NXY57DRAFT_1044725, partial [Lentinula lateritia]